MKFMKKNKHTNAYFISGAAITVLFIILMLIGLIHTPYDPNAMNGAEKFSSPSFSHIMGTDNFGRDIFSRVLKGISMTGLVAVSTVAIGGSIGTITGAVTGYYGGAVDEIVMRINDALNGFPSILIALIIVSIIGPGKYNVILALGILFIPSFARIVRSEYISLKERDFVKSARLMGAGNMRIIFRHIFPNIRSTLFALVNFTPQILNFKFLCTINNTLAMCVWGIAVNQIPIFRFRHRNLEAFCMKVYFLYQVRP